VASRQSGESEPTPEGPGPTPPAKAPSSESTDTPAAPPKRIRVVGGGNGGEERLTPPELKKRFATNLDALLGITGLSRKDAATEVGIEYKLMRRLVSAGVSFVEDRNRDTIDRLRTFFALPGNNYLWRAGLVRFLLTSLKGRPFIDKLRHRLLAERERRLAAARAVDHEEVALVGKALGVGDADPPPLRDPLAEKVAAILASDKAGTFRRIINDYYQLVKRHDPETQVGSGEGEASPGGAGSGGAEPSARPTPESPPP
jgi:hypothetical protein